MEPNQNPNDEQTIDLFELLAELLNKAFIIFLAIIVGALAAAFITKTMITPVYSSTAKLYVKANNESTSVSNSDLQAGANLTTDYEEIIQSRQIAETVISKLMLTNADGEIIGYSTLLSELTVSTPTDSRVINITITDEDPYLACDIANEFMYASMEHIQNVMSIETISIVEHANIPTQKDSPSTMKNMMIGALVGAVISILIILIIFLTNDTIRTSEDVERYLGLSALGIIPLETEDKSSAKKKRRKTRPANPQKKTRPAAAKGGK